MHRLFVVLVAIAACNRQSLTVDLPAVTYVELDVYSGRPNPRWQLTEQEVRQLENRLSGLPQTSAVEIPGNLGYRGFRIHDGQSRITVTNNGYVVVHDATTDKFYRDTRNVETWLKRQAETRGYGGPWSRRDGPPPRKR